MDRHSLTVLGFDKICEFLKSYASSPGGKRQCEALIPSKDKEYVNSLLKQNTEMRLAIELQGCLPLNGVNDIKRPVERSRILNFYLEPENLQNISQTIEAADSIRKYFSDLETACPLLFQITRRLIPLNHITDRINKSVSSKGEILDSASPDLAEIRSGLKKLRLRIIKILEQMINNEYISHAFQDDFITLRNKRYVIPIRSDSKSAVPGVVHDQSQSKATFFVEPLSIVNLNNELQILQKEEYYEEIKILTELTKLVKEHSEEILTDLNILEQIDVIHARALFSIALNATEPVINTDGIIELIQCRHPFLLAQFVEDEEEGSEDSPEKLSEEITAKGRWEFNRSGIMPVNLIKGGGTSTLIITGANAGGKTVAMKTLGLLVLMTQAGIHIPAEEGSRISIYDTIFADIGDEQNIETSLSTFSAHMAQIKFIVNNVSKSSLVLLDELGSGTDPSEGGALAVSILDFLRESGCSTVITTHLNMLKTYAYNHSDVENVSVEFDPDTLKPTYSLVYGVPGISNALAIANNIGVPQKILKNAEKYIDESEKQIGVLIVGLEKTHKEILEEKNYLIKIKNLALKFQQASENLLESIKNRKDKILSIFEINARKLLKESEEELTKLIKEQKRVRIIRPNDLPKHTEETKESFSKVKQKLFEKIPKSDVKREQVEHLKVGQVVKVFHLKKKGVVVSVDNNGKKAEVAIGTMRVKTAFNELEMAEDQNEPRAINEEKSFISPYQNNPESVREIKVNVIGLRSEEALPVVDKTIDNALLLGASTVEVIHGRGTGRLMNAIHQHLKDHQFVSRFEQGDVSKGGSGVTVVHIK